MTGRLLLASCSYIDHVNSDDKSRLSVFLREIEHQGTNVRIGWSLLQQALEEKNYDLVFFAVQSVLAAGAAVSRMLAPPRPHPRTTKDPRYQKRAVLLATWLPGAAANPVLLSREVRNALEHFEEHVEDFIPEWDKRYIMDRTVTDQPLEEMFTVDDGSQVRALRSVRVDLNTVSVLDWTVDLSLLAQAVVDAAEEASSVVEIVENVETD